MYSHQPHLEVPTEFRGTVNDAFLMQLAAAYAEHFGRMQGAVTAHAVGDTSCDELYTEAARLRGSLQRAIRDLCHEHGVDIDAPHYAI